MILPVKLSVYLLFTVFVLSQCRPKQEEKFVQFPGKPVVPHVLMEEHDSLLYDLNKLRMYKDSTGSVAERLYVLLDHHFQEEEDFVLPPLGLLVSMSKDSLPQNKTAILQMIDKLEEQAPHMNVEHQMIKLYLNDLHKEAQIDGHPEVERFRDKLVKHAQMEEAILFPTAILLGDYLRLKTK